MGRNVPYALLLGVAMILPMDSMAGVNRMRTRNRVVALTFDDGPNPPYTEELLGILSNKQVSATFFLVGSQVEQYPNTARSILSAGHDVGGHAYGWEPLLLKGKGFVEGELAQMESAFRQIGVTKLSLFRPPGGILLFHQEKLVEARGYAVVGADVVVGDWKAGDAETIAKRVVKKVRPGSIVALHDGGGDRSATLAAVPMIIDRLKAMGYGFVPIGFEQ